MMDDADFKDAKFEDPKFDDLKSYLGQLEAFGHRGSATSKEKEAAQWLAEQLAEKDIAVDVESFSGHNSYGVRILVHLAIGLAGLLLIFFAPLLAVAVTSLNLISFVLETSGYPLGLSALFRSPSQNVVGRVPVTDELKRRVIVCAHYDTQRTGWIWNASRASTIAATLARAPGPLKGPLFLLSIIFSLQALAGLALANGWAFLVPNWLMYVLGFFYLLGFVLIGQWAFGGFVPGANDNGSGVACGLRLAASWKPEEHPETELVLLSGCEESGLVGASSWARRHRRELAEVPTYFVNLDTLGCTHLHYLANECALNGLVWNYPRETLDICESIAHDLDLNSCEPHLIPTQTDGLPFLLLGVPGITLSSSEQGVFVPHYHLPSDRKQYLNLETIAQAAEFATKFISVLEQQ